MSLPNFVFLSLSSLRIFKKKLDKGFSISKFRLKLLINKFVKTSKPIMIIIQNFDGYLNLRKEICRCQKCLIITSSQPIMNSLAKPLKYRNILEYEETFCRACYFTMWSYKSVKKNWVTELQEWVFPLSFSFLFVSVIFPTIWFSFVFFTQKVVFILLNN